MEEMPLQLRLGFELPRNLRREGPTFIAKVRRGKLPRGVRPRPALAPAELASAWEPPASKLAGLLAMAHRALGQNAQELEAKVREGILRVEALAADPDSERCRPYQEAAPVERAWAALLQVDFPRAHALARQTCVTEEHALYGLRHSLGALAAAPAPESDLAAFVAATAEHENLLAYGLRWLRSNAAFDRARAAEVLVDSARRGSEANIFWLHDVSIRALAMVDWREARTAVEHHSGDLRPELRAALCEHDSAAELKGRLRAVGALLETPVARELAMPAVTSLDFLIEAGLAHPFDAECGYLPVDHDAWLAAVAGLVSPHLEGAAFGQREPRDPEDEEQTYSLYASDGGSTWSITAENHGDYFDVWTAIGLLNALLEKRGAAPRILFADEDCEILLVGHPSALLAATEAGLLEVYDP